MDRIRSRDRRILTASLMVILAASVMLTGIYAYLTARDFRENLMSAGNSIIDIKETFENPDIEPEGTTTITKKVSVENNGINYSAVRVKARFSDESLLAVNGGPAAVDYNEEYWERSSDGYWYYKEPLAPGDSTPALFTSITITDPGEKAKDFDVYVYAESRDCGENDSKDAIKGKFL